jgi:signal transduction histidine kinase
MSTTGESPRAAERTFLHDIATPMAVALGMVDLLLEDASDGSASLSDAQKKRLEKAQTALLKLQEMMAARRQILIAADNQTT